MVLTELEERRKLEEFEGINPKPPGLLLILTHEKRTHTLLSVPKITQPLGGMCRGIEVSFPLHPGQNP